MEKLIKQIRECKVCEPHLPLGANPIISASRKSKIAIIGQAPGIIVHDTKKPWNDRSGKQLRDWLGVSEDEFYSTDNFALVPMGFCYPGKGKGGDLPPRKECAPLWHDKVFDAMDLRLILLIGIYSQKYYLGKEMKNNLTQTVKHYKEYLPNYFPTPHPSPRNLMWQRRNPWFMEDNVPHLQKLVRSIID